MAVFSGSQDQNLNTSHEKTRQRRHGMMGDDRGRAMEFRQKGLTEGRRDAGPPPPWPSRPRPPPSRASRRLCTPSRPSSVARRCGCSSPTGSPAAFWSCPLDGGELRHGGSHASDTASSKRRRRRRGHLTERVQRRVRLFVHLRRRGTRVGGGRVALPDGEWLQPALERVRVGWGGRRLDFHYCCVWTDLIEYSRDAAAGGETFRRKDILARAKLID